MKLRFVVLAIAIVTLNAIPPTMIDAGSITVAGPWTDPSLQVVNFNYVFPSTPQFGLLLSSFEVHIGGPLYGFDVDAGTLTSVSAQFSMVNASYNVIYGTTINSLKYRWVACLGEHLQIFPIFVMAPETVDQNHLQVIDVPFDYPNLVQWSSGNFQVGITSVLSSFTYFAMYLSQADITIAKWDDGNGAYAYSGNSAFVLDNTNLFGENCPFTTVDSVNVVKLAMQGFTPNFLRINLIFHKVDLAGPIYTGYNEVRNNDPNAALGSYTTDITDPNYNQPITDPNTIRIYGIETFKFIIRAMSTMVVEISTDDGINTIANRQSDVPTEGFEVREFYASYLPVSVSNVCSPGCICASGTTCSSCDYRYYHVLSPVTTGTADICPCLNGYYWDFDSTCKQCTQSTYCKTCHINTEYHYECLTCDCAKHRELNYLGECVCKTGYHEPTPSGPYCIKD